MGGGGGAGAISHSAYMETAHKALLNRGGVVGVNFSIFDALNDAFVVGASPFLGTLAYNPDTDLGVNTTAIGALKTLVDALAYVTDVTGALTTFSSAVVADTASLDVAVAAVATLPVDILDTTVLDVAILDTAVLPIAILDTFLISDAQVTADVLAYSSVLESDLVQITLPKYKASMFNIGAVSGSAFILGEALLRGEKLRQVATYTADLRYKLNLQANEINARFISERREIDAKFQLRFQEMTAQYKVQYAELTSKFKLAFMEVTSKYKIQHKDKSTELQVQFQDLSAKFKLEFQELTARFKIQNQEINAQFKNQRWVTVRGLVSQALQDLMKRTELEVDLTRFTLESNRLKIIAKTEQAQEQLLINQHDKTWNLEAFAFGTSVLGGIGAGAFIPNKKSKAVSALSGALSGAASGAAVGSNFGGYGAVIGGAAGAVLGATGGALQ